MSEKKEPFTAADPIETILDCIEIITLNPLKGVDAEVGHLDICINFRYPVACKLFEALIRLDLTVILFDKSGTVIKNMPLKKIDKINRIFKDDKLFLSFSTRTTHKGENFVTSFVPIENKYEIIFSHPNADNPISKKFIVFPIL